MKSKYVFRVEFLGGSVILAAAIFAVLARGTIEPSVVGIEKYQKGNF